MQIKVTAVVAGKSYESTIAAPDAPAPAPATGQTAAQAEAFARNTAMLQAVSGAIGVHSGTPIDSITVSVA